MHETIRIGWANDHQSKYRFGDYVPGRQDMILVFRSALSDCDIASAPVEKNERRPVTACSRGALQNRWSKTMRV